MVAAIVAFHLAGHNDLEAGLCHAAVPYIQHCDAPPIHALSVVVMNLMKRSTPSDRSPLPVILAHTLYSFTVHGHPGLPAEFDPQGMAMGNIGYLGILPPSCGE